MKKIPSHNADIPFQKFIRGVFDSVQSPETSFTVFL